jgi:flagellar hook-associated protein 2
MSDIYMPGVKSRFNTNELVDNLMKVERIPKDRSEKNVEGFQTQKTYWQDVGRYITALRDSARFLYSYQNPFNDRVVNSSNPAALTGTTTREAGDQDHFFTIKQIAQADRFLSDPLPTSFRANEGAYTFSIGEDKISFNFRGGTLQEFSEALNRRGRDKIRASLITVQPGKKSLLIESRVTGAENRLGFADAALDLAVRAGIIEAGAGNGTNAPSSVVIQEEPITVDAGATALIPFNVPKYSETASLRFEIATTLHEPEGASAPDLSAETAGAVPAESAAEEAAAEAAAQAESQAVANANAAKRVSDGRHPFEGLRGSLQHSGIFSGDPVEIIRKMRDEW